MEMINNFYSGSETFEFDGNRGEKNAHLVSIKVK